MDVATMPRFNDSQVVLVDASLSISEQALLDFLSSMFTPFVQSQSSDNNTCI